MHVTGYLYDDERVVERFIGAAMATGFFAEAAPIRLSGRIRAVAFYSKDLDGISDELEMPGVAAKLSGILADDIVIASAWDHPAEESTTFARSYRDREHVWLVRGSGRHMPGEVIREPRELPAT